MHQPNKLLSQSDERVKLADVLLQDLRDLHRRICDTAASINHGLKTGELSQPDQADVGFLARESAALLDEMRKEMKSAQELAGKLIAAKVTQQSVANPSKSTDTVRGKLCSAMANMRMEAQLPEKGTAERLQLLVHLGVPEELAKRELIKPDWNNMAEYVTELVSSGKKAPPGVGRMWPKFTCIFRKNS